MQMQTTMLNKVLTEDRVISTSEAKTFDSLSKLTNKALDKIVPDLSANKTEIDIKQFNRIEVVNLTELDASTMQSLSITPHKEDKEEESQ
jgi:hypothetical protein